MLPHKAHDPHCVNYTQTFFAFKIKRSRLNKVQKQQQNRKSVCVCGGGGGAKVQNGNIGF